MSSRRSRRPCATPACIPTGRAGRSSRELEENDAKRQALFDRVLRAELERWLEIAKSKLDGSTDLFVMAGNDDPWFVDEVLDDAEVVTLCDERIVRVGDHEMISLSYANPHAVGQPARARRAGIT